MRYLQVADDLAAANISVILTANRGAPDTFEKINTLPGPPLSKMAAEVLADAGVVFGLAIAGESEETFTVSRTMLIRHR